MFKIGDTAYLAHVTKNYQQQNPIKVNYLKERIHRMLDEEGNLEIKIEQVISDDGHGWISENLLVKHHE